jgi:DNA topoisomerase-2
MDDSIQKKYRVMTDIEHVLERPGTYIGAVERCESTHWVVRDDRMALTTETIVPALFKLADEVLVNSRDHSVRCAGTDAPVTYIDVVFSEDGTISVENDGAGITVARHPLFQDTWIPEVIFGKLRSSTNFDAEEKKIVGGQNGFGVKLAFIWSTLAEIDLAGPNPEGTLLRYVQTFRKNLTVIDPPKVTTYKKKKGYTKITFQPDYARFGLPGLEPAMRELLTKRLYDLAAVTDKKVKVSLNGVPIAVKSFLHYVDLYIGPKETAERVAETAERWEYVVSLSEEFHHVSFVNGIVTSKGGKHVDYVMNQLIKKVAAYIKLKKKVDVKPAVIREQLTLFLNCCIENPSFDSQSKDYLTTPAAAFGSECEVSDKFAEKVARMGVMDAALEMTQRKESAALKKTDGAKRRTIHGIPKLSDAAFAGTAKSGTCTLFLCEGDSAMAGIKSGLTEEMRKTFGVFPLKGKPINPRRSPKKAAENKEIVDLKQILGLESGRSYTAEEARASLRYGRVVLMTDQDLDGSHIKGLCVNIFDTLWPSLLRAGNFLGFMNTPIIKARKGAQELLFYNDGQYQAWKDTAPKGWAVKYYKGLGTSTGKEFTQYLKLNKEGAGNVIHFEWTAESADCIGKVFDETRADDRKAWLGDYDAARFVDTARPTITYESFVDDEMIHFSKHDNERSIASAIDGFKPSQRKILFAAFKKNLTKEIKVAQFSGYVSEHSAYHHGEASLNGAIVGMAQNFVGSNNVNLLLPNGQFGTRLKGGKDSASERYIFTELNPMTRALFPADDDCCLKYLEDDGLSVEPNYYIPIIPMVLVNGCKGIGTGFSTDVPCFNPAQLVDCLVAKLRGEEYTAEFVPFYRGFKGRIEAVGDKYATFGVFTVTDLTVKITELPVGVWTDDYKDMLEGLVGTVVKEYTDHSTDLAVNFTVKLLAPVESIEKTLKLVAFKSVTNMNLFDANEKLTKYASVQAIIDAFYPVRLAAYTKRKAVLLEALSAKLERISNKVAYIKAVLDGSVDLRSKKNGDISALLLKAGFVELEGNFNYLTKMPMDSVSFENVETLTREKAEIQTRLAKLSATSEQEFWLQELKCMESTHC